MPQSLHEYGAQAALPLWIQFMQAALKGKPEHTFAEPPDILSLPIDPMTGRRVAAGDPVAIQEYFMTNTLPEDANKQDDSLIQNNLPSENADENQENHPNDEENPNLIQEDQASPDNIAD